MRIRNKRTRQRARSTSLTTQGQATDAFGEVATMDYGKVGRENRHHDGDNCRPSQQHTPGWRQLSPFPAAYARQLVLDQRAACDEVEDELRATDNRACTRKTEQGARTTGEARGNNDRLKENQGAVR